MRKLLPPLIHGAHAAWMVALWFSVDGHGAITSYSLFLPPFIFAGALEIWRWWLLGKEPVTISGAYALGTALDEINRQFVCLSWYVTPPLPPMKLFERYSWTPHTFPIEADCGQVLAKFYLMSELTMPLIAGIGLLLMNAYPGTAPQLYGLGGSHFAGGLFWLVGFGALNKSLSLYFFAVSVRLGKGF